MKERIAGIGGRKDQAEAQERRSKEEEHQVRVRSRRRRQRGGEERRQGEARRVSGPADGVARREASRRRRGEALMRASILLLLLPPRRLPMQVTRRRRPLHTWATARASSSSRPTSTQPRDARPPAPRDQRGRSLAWLAARDRAGQRLRPGESIT